MSQQMIECLNNELQYAQHSNKSKDMISKPEFWLIIERQYSILSQLLTIASWIFEIEIKDPRC